MKYLIFVIALFLVSCVTTNESLTRDSVEDKMGINSSEVENIPVENTDVKSSDYKEIEKLLEEGDLSDDLFNKLMLYKEAQEVAINKNYDDIDYINESINELLSIMDIYIDYSTYSNENLSPFIASIVTGKGYRTNEIGYLTLEVELSGNDAQLDNDYYNKFWNLSVSLIDSRGNIINSDGKSGRVSHISEESLDRLIEKEAKKSLKKILNSMLP